MVEKDVDNMLSLLLRWRTLRQAMRLCGISSTSRSHSSSVRAAQLQFLTLLCLTIIIVFIYLHLLSSYPVESGPRPSNVRPTFYYTAEVEDSRKLGNTMFAFASLIGISSHNNATPVISSRIRLTQIFKIRASQTGDMLNTMGGGYLDHEEYGRRGGAYDIRTRYLHEKKTNVRLMGYFQSFKYFTSAEADVRDNFRFNDDINTQAVEFHRMGIPEDWIDRRGSCVRVGIHIRQGDMNEDYYKNYGYVTAPLDYFVKAMNYFKSRYDCIVFIVCSNDIKWAQENIRHERVVFSVGRSPGVDMAILSLCDHVIVSVGSYGWWAGWLANGTTVYYDKWPRSQSQLEYQVEKRDYFPPHWIGMH